MVHTITRSEIVSFFDLTEAEQDAILQEVEIEEAEQEMYVFSEGEPLSLANFMRTGNKARRHGVYGLSAFSAYFVTLSKCGTVAVVTYESF